MKIEKKAKGKGKAKGKAIIGIAMAAIILASVFVAMVPAATAVKPGVTVDKTIASTTAFTPVTYTFTVTNLGHTDPDTFTVTYPALPGTWVGAPPSGFVVGPIAKDASVTFQLTLMSGAAGDSPISVPVTVTSATATWYATTKTIGCYVTPLLYNGLRNVIAVPATATPPAEAPSNSVLIGQVLDLSAFPPAQLPATIKGDPTNPATAGQIFTTDSAGIFDAAVMTVTGTYYINPVGGTSVASPTTCWGVLLVADPTMDLDLRVNDRYIWRSITQGTPLQIRFTNNLDQNDMVTLKIIDPDGNQIKSTAPPKYPSTQKFARINVQLISDVYGIAGSDTTNWKIGTYTFQVMTDKDVATWCGARGLDASSNEKTLTIRPSEIAIYAEKTVVAEAESVRLTVTGVTDHVITIDSSDWQHTLFPGGLDNNPPTDTTAPFTDTIDVDGRRTYAVEFFDTGSYTITVTDTTTVPQMTDTVDITVCPKAVTFDMPATVALGEKLTIRGTANTGDLVAIAFDDRIPSAAWGSLTIGADGEFRKDIMTGAYSASEKLKTPGSVRVKAFINWMLPAGATFPYDASDLVADGTTMILLASQNLTAELSGTEIALDDSFIIRGTADGPRFVEILTVSPKGVSGNGLRAVSGIGFPWPWDAPYTGCTYDSTAVSETDHTFSKKLDVRENADTGSYLVAVLSSGIDGKYGHNLGHNLQDALNNGYGDISAKTQKQVLSILEEMTTTAGSDDLMWIGYIKIGKPYVTLEPIPDVQVGEPLWVTGSTNRGEGMTIVITVEGPKKLPPGVVSVKNNKFTAVFDTTGIPLGTYTVTADDGDDYTDTTTVNVIKAKISASIATNKVVYSPGDVMTTSIHLLNPTGDTQNLLFKWYLEIPGYNLSTKIMETEVHLAAASDLTFAIPIPVGNWGAESFCGYHIASLADTTTKKVVTVDSTAWIYVPRGVSESKTTAEIAKEIKKSVEGVEFGGEKGKNGNKNETER